MNLDSNTCLQHLRSSFCETQALHCPFMVPLQALGDFRSMLAVEILFTLTLFFEI